ncbi:Nitrogen assimilation regulatory protein Nac [plant metagenome]|uniref:Nitrogen assimilation regulatory protein Nac n=1 Tax=plant metagenome TaxID=1297885 RepID=A0A484R462_9ZZZZ
MTLAQLRYFLAIVRAGSMSAAAELVHVAQPALSQQIRQLEGELGQALFRRHARGIRLTDAGLRFQERAFGILRQVDALRDEFISTRAEPVGQVTLGMATAVNTAFLLPICLAVRRRHPGITLRLVESMSGFLMEWAEQGRVDLALAYEAASAPGLDAQRLGRESLFLIAAPGWRAPVKRRLGLADLARIPMVLPGFPHSLRILLDRSFAQRGLRLNVTAEVDSTLGMKQLVAAGVGCSILSRHSVAEEVGRGELAALPIARPGVSRSIDLLTGVQRRSDPAVQAVRAVVEEVVRAGLAPQEG